MKRQDERPCDYAATRRIEKAINNGAYHVGSVREVLWDERQPDIQGDFIVRDRHTSKLFKIIGILVDMGTPWNLALEDEEGGIFPHAIDLKSIVPENEETREMLRRVGLQPSLFAPSVEWDEDGRIKEGRFGPSFK